MKKALTILAIIASVLAIIFAVLPISNFAVFPAVIAIIFGLAAYYLSKRTGEVKKIIQFSFILTSLALAISTYKAYFTKTEVANTEVLDAKETQFEEEAIDELENLDIDTNENTDVNIEQ
ncbi:FUSC family protein [Mariniflexile maritimum]|jgi:carbon starvation protein CstA|uniref:FUSC family protein n=1 Tax=Mariniflexile maritimum TaxID=2682493 RepID=UPI0012F655C6|nr:FUSC family protein [Mariniflexile maritimum]MCB0450107.1 FUSC family protein [Confluentibacter sp.]HMQ44747.1 FUSC family protein [Mariniflexile sp.]